MMMELGKRKKHTARDEENLVMDQAPQGVPQRIAGFGNLATHQNPSRRLNLER